MYAARRHRIARALAKIRERAFGEDDIRLLLIELRDSLPARSLLQEVAHFVAHPEKRNRGLSLRDINLTAFKTRRVLLHKKDPIDLCVMDDSFFWNYLLYGLEQIPGRHWTKRQDIPKNVVIEFIKNRYVKRGRKWHLRAGCTEKDIVELSKIAALAFDIIYPEPLLPQDKVIGEIDSALRIIGRDYHGEIGHAPPRDRTEIMLCILCVMQHVRFDLDTGATGRLLWFTMERPDEASVSLMASFEDGPFPTKYHFAFAYADARPSEYGLDTGAEGGPLVFESECFNAERLSDGRLTLRRAD